MTEVTGDRKYCLVLVFEAKALQLKDFEERQLEGKTTFMKFICFPTQKPSDAGGGKQLLCIKKSLLTLGSSCSVLLFWCYEIASWGLVSLYGGTAFFLRRKAAVVLDQGDFVGRNIRLEMLEPVPTVTSDMERCVNEGFEAWMGSSLKKMDQMIMGRMITWSGGYLPRTNFEEQRS